MLNVTPDDTDFAAAEKFNGHNLYSYAKTSANSEIVAARDVKPNRGADL
jgi:hypothetical protein